MSKEILQDIIKDFNPDKFVRFFRDKNRTFAPKKEELIQYDDNNLRNGVKLGEIDFSGSEQMTICAIETVHALSERSGKKAQYKEGKKILKERQYDAGIFIFYDQKGNFRFSLIYANYLGSRRDWSAFRRFTYFVSKELTNKTFLQRIGDGDFSSLYKIKEAFSVEKVTKEFYTDIAYWYFWAVQHVKFPADAEKEENGRNIAVIRMITRLIFIWFMKERGLISQSLFNQSNISTLLNDLSFQKTTYYKAILQNLFFATLNTKIKDRKFRFSKSFQGRNKNYMDHGIYRYEDYFKNREDMLEVFRDIPFLNGGLFDCMDRRETQNEKNVEIRMDGFTDKEVGLNVPNFLFFSDETNADLNKEYGTINKKYKVSGLIDILSSYNFTIDENDPNDQEVALDPELLGKVFENLLASFNPETASTARKATGSYYTPREIVDYMVTQSLKEYFKTHLKETDEPLNPPPLTGGGEGEGGRVFSNEIDSKVDLLFTHDSEINPFNKSDTSRMVTLIDNLRIVDPAVGSGAFPMGILNKLVFILSKLDPDNALWKETQIKAVEKSVPDPIVKQKLKEQIEGQFTEKNLDYGRKLYLIQKCIYGVDIQQIAVEIAKLRFLISLLVDERIDKTKENWGIEPLPNLDFKIMQGNSLISEFMGIDLDDDSKDKGQRSFFCDGMDELISQFKQKKNEYQNEPDRDKKERLKEEVDNLIIAMFETKLKKQKSDYFSQLQAIENKYLVTLNEKERNEIIAKEKETLYKKTGFNLEAIERQLREFTDGIKGKPFFAWKLYFAEVFHTFSNSPLEKGDSGGCRGFDIVIANPPYGAEIDEITLKKIKQNLVDTNNSNSAALFIDYGKNRLIGKNGTLTFIVPKSLLYSENWFSLVKSMLGNVSILVDVEKAFENVKLEQVVFVYSKSIHAKKYLARKFLDNEFIRSTNVPNDLVLKYKAWICDVSQEELDIAKNLKVDCVYMKDISETKRGVGLQKYLSPEGDYPVIGGKNIFRYGCNGVKGYLSKDVLSGERNKLSFMQQPKIISQDLVAHIQNPTPRIMITSFFDSAGKIIGLDTVQNTIITNNEFDYKYILALLNSTFVSWYTYKFIYCSAIRTMHFDNYYVGKIPIPKISNWDQHPVVTLVDQILAAKQKDPDADTSALEKQIDQMVYTLYDLTSEEIAIVEGVNCKIIKGG